MSEEDLPIPYEERLKPARKEKLLSRKKWDETWQRYIKLNPESDPAEVVRLSRAVQRQNNPNTTPKEREKAKVVETLRQERLREQGLDPTEWAYHHATQPQKFGINDGRNEDAPLTEDDMARIASRFPKGIELFVIPGLIHSGMEYETQNPFRLAAHLWEIYVRVRPEAPPLGNQAQIEGPTPTE